MNIFAHRGLLQEYPENSLTALIKAVEYGFDIETDIRLTKDNDFIIIHDDTLERLTGKKLNVADLDLHEATNLTYSDSTEHVISLRSFLQKLQDKHQKPVLALHLKADSQNEIAYNKLSEYWKTFNVYDSAFVFDLTINAAKHLKKIDPAINIACIVSETQFEPTIHLWEDVQDETCFDIVWAAEYRSFYTQELIQEMKQKKRNVYAMSPDVHAALGHPLASGGYEETWKKLILWGVDGICTDEPLKLQELSLK